MIGIGALVFVSWRKGFFTGIVNDNTFASETSGYSKTNYSSGAAYSGNPTADIVTSATNGAANILQEVKGLVEVSKKYNNERYYAQLSAMYMRNPFAS